MDSTGFIHYHGDGGLAQPRELIVYGFLCRSGGKSLYRYKTVNPIDIKRNYKLYARSLFSREFLQKIHWPKLFEMFPTPRCLRVQRTVSVPIHFSFVHPSMVV